MPGVDKSLQCFKIRVNAEKVRRKLRQICRGYMKAVKANKTEEGQKF